MDEATRRARDQVLGDVFRGDGTYLKVVSHPFGHFNDDAFLILYLRPQGKFLFLGYWRGYERSVAAGQWHKRGNVIRLDGRGHVSSDSAENDGDFARTLNVGDVQFTPSLSGEEAKGWSLLSWTGPFIYAGQFNVINPDDEWLPGSISEVDMWIDKYS